MPGSDTELHEVTEQARRASEERYRSLFTSMTEGFALHEILCDAQGRPCDYRFLEVNPAFEALTGLTRDRVVGKRLSEVLPTDDPKWVEIYGDVALTGNSVRFDHYSPALKRHYEVFSYSPARHRFAAMFTDITERKRTEEALRHSEERYRSLVELSPTAVYINRRNRIVFANPAALQLFGVTDAAQLLGKSPFDVFHPDCHAVIANRLRLLEQGRSVALNEEKIVRLDGTVRLVEVAAAPFCDAEGLAIQVVLRDVTERRRMEEENRSLARFPSENPHPVLRVNPEGVVLYANAAARPLLEEWHCLVGGGVPAHWRGVVAEAFAGLQPRSVDVRCGERIYALLIAPLADVGYANLYGSDVTERRRAERALAQTHDELEQKVDARTAELLRANRTLRMITECNQALVRAHDELGLGREICQVVQALGGYRMAWVGYAEGDAAKSVRPVASVGFEEGYLEHAQITWADDVRGRGPTGRCIRERAVCLGRDFVSDPALAPWRQLALERGFASSIALPLIAGTEVVGALTIYAYARDAFDDNQVALLTELANDLAFGILALRARAERDHARELAEVRAQQLRALAVELGQAEQRERQRLAKVLHDQLQQLLVGARFRLAAAQNKTETATVRRSIQHVSKIVEEATEIARSLTTELSPPALQEGGLAGGLQWLGRQMKLKHGLKVQVQADGAANPASEDVRLLVFEAVRELLFNVVKHAGVDRARVGLTKVGDTQIQVIVSDQGAGFDAVDLASQSSAGGHFGLFSIRERLKYFDGHLKMHSAPGRGSQFTLVVPLAEPASPSLTTRPA